jgi:hypothetical protein
MWIIGEYDDSNDEIKDVMNKVRKNIGEIKLVDDEISSEEGEKVDEDKNKKKV